MGSFDVSTLFVRGFLLCMLLYAVIWLISAFTHLVQRLLSRPKPWDYRRMSRGEPSLERSSPEEIEWHEIKPEAKPSRAQGRSW